MVAQGTPNSEPHRLSRILVDRLLEQKNIRTTRVEQAFRAVPRHLFVPGVSLEEAYSEEAIVSHRGPDGQPRSSSSMPAIMAVMIEQLNVRPGHRVLEIGAGSGYNAAILAELVGQEGEVTTIDIDEDIVHEAREHLTQAGFRRVEVVLGDGWVGVPARGPFNRIEATVGVWDLSPYWVEQLATGGMIVVPLWLRPTIQASIAFRAKDGNMLQGVSIEPCGFMRLRGPNAGPEGYVWVDNWVTTVDEPDLRKIEILQRLLKLPTRQEVAPELPRGWFLRLAFGDSRAIRLSARSDWRRQKTGVFAPEDMSLALISEGIIEVFGNDRACAILGEHLARSAPLDLKQLSITALPTPTVSSPKVQWEIVRPGYTFCIQELGLPAR